MPTISNTVTINGNGATLVRDNNAPAFRFFLVGYTGNLSLNNLTLFNGYSNDYGLGGAVLNKGGTLFLNSTTFYSNTGTYGGAIANSGHGTDTYSNTVSSRSYTATLDVKNSTFISNSVVSLGLRGGAIYSSAIGGYDRDGNQVKAGDGSTFVKISGSTFISNTAVDGGAIANNVLAGDGSNGGSAIAFMDISNSTFSANQGAQGAGAVLNQFQNSSQSTSLATGVLSITNSTLVSNTSLPNTGAIITLKTYSSVVTGTLTTTLRNTIMSSNTGGNCLATNGAVFAPGLNNLEYTGSSGSASCGSGSTLVTTNPVMTLTPANNGGPTLTILPTGPAHDGGDNSTCAAPPVSNFDQRGASRPIGAACDVGAVESGGDFVVRNNTDSGDGLTVGSLSFYLKNATGGQTISFALNNGKTIRVSGPLPPLVRNARLGTSCADILIDGTGVIGDGLSLGGNNTLVGLTIKGFVGRQIITAGTGNRLLCTKATRN